MRLAMLVPALAMLVLSACLPTVTTPSSTIPPQETASAGRASPQPSPAVTSSPVRSPIVVPSPSPSPSPAPVALAIGRPGPLTVPTYTKNSCHYRTGGLPDPACTPGALNGDVRPDTLNDTICKS